MKKWYEELLERIFADNQRGIVLSDAPIGEKLAREYGWKLDVDGINYQDAQKAWWM